ncbi:MAG: hydrogenase maturation protease [Deltaproteobacteria bacterium]|nr:HyaD/HybD family hydrogenase maturation endopeptidase [Deltaproteobacteria bacterium]MBW2076410.1 HyaD/HybD family hydrogenase maturation endopeptidase [Deltaproteobacteria bacterium]RLB27765.1 MAG: hydrogenase maturation protease [Deltaproteobacteria bacterium]
MTRKRTLILGIGNLILKDEGIGVHVVRALEEKKLPPEVGLIDGGTATMDLLSVIYESERIIVIDALKAGGEPGTIYRCLPEDLMETSDRPLSLHQLGLLDVLGMSRQLGGDAAVVIIGVEPKEISWGLELTEELQAVVPKVVKAVKKELRGLGY